MIARETGALVIPGLRIDRDLTRALFLASPCGSKATSSDMRNGWMATSAVLLPVVAELPRERVEGGFGKLRMATLHLAPGHVRG